MKSADPARPLYPFRSACFARAAIAVAVSVVSSNPANGGPYDALPLRSDLSPLPYFATAGDREGKRFADQPVNRYRLYDFYRRQADFEIANSTDPSRILPPFPELDGGRRGHWGGTNEKDSTAFDRPHGPEFTSISGRLGAGQLYQISGPDEDPGVLVFDTLHPGLKEIFLHAKLVAPESTFSLAVDRFGFKLEVVGKSSFKTASDEWTREGKGIARFASYHVQGEAVAFQLQVGKTSLLDMPSIIPSKDGMTRFVVRNFEFLGDPEVPLDFSLPSPSGTSTTPAQTITKESNGAFVIRKQYGDTVSLDLVQPAPGVTCEPSKDSRLSISKAADRGRLIVVNWSGTTGKEAGVAGAMKEIVTRTAKVQPDMFLTGGAPRFPKTITVKGRLNADPQASGGSYEIDDIPVPSDNPYHLPMTLSGIAFDRDGTAYICTLVGDVWKVTGLQGDLGKVVWKRYAAGLDLPLGIEVVDGVPCVNVRRHILRLRDLNGDGEADSYERVNQMNLPTADECGRDLRRDAAGNYYFNTLAAIYRLSADGSKLDTVGDGSRNPLGLAVRKDGLVLSDSSEGNSNNGTCTIYESDHPENANTTAKKRRILYLPRGVDNSPGSRMFMAEPRFGPLGSEGTILGTSFGTGSWYYMVRDRSEGTSQAAMIPMRGLFSSGSCRLAVQPLDGQVFVAGLDGWGDYAVTEGCLHRLRYTGRKSPALVAWEPCRNGLMLHFDQEVKVDASTAKAFFVQQWNYVDSPKTYGSPEYSVKAPGMIGHDRLEVASVSVESDHRSVFLEIPALLPAMCTQIHGPMLDSREGRLVIDLYATINRLHPDHPAGKASLPEKPQSLVVPEKDDNGDTYQNIVNYFDRLAGRDVGHRAVAPEVNFRKEDLNYRWIRENLVNRQCMPCHGAGTQHDLTTYEGMMKKIYIREPGKSPLYGMISTSSMPPYPLPEVSPGMRKAVAEWIKAGAPD